MISIKRGIILVVMVMFLLIPIVIAVNEWIPKDMIGEDSIHAKQYGAMKTNWWSGNVKFGDSLWTDDFCEDSFSNDVGWNSLTIPSGYNCDTHPCCVLQLTDKDNSCGALDWSCDDECSETFAASGTVISPSKANEITYVGNLWNYDGGHHPSHLQSYENSFICDGYVWKECGPNTLGYFLDIILPNPEIAPGEEIVHTAYFCTKTDSYGSEFSFDWVTMPDTTIDQDGDGRECTL